VLNQTFRNWECLVIDDGSTDDTESVAGEFCRKDIRFKYIRKKNGGLSSARNTGIDICRGEFIQFLDSDDIILPEKIETQLLQFRKNSEADVSVTGYRLFRDNPDKSFDTSISLNDYKCNLEGFLYSWNDSFVFPPVCGLIKKDIITNNKILFDITLRAFEDWVFWIKMSIAGAKFISEEKKLALYRRHDSNMSSDINLMSQSIMQACFIVYDMLEGDSKNTFSRNIYTTVISTVKALLAYETICKRADSFEYRLGNNIMKPLKIFVRNIRMIKRWVMNLR
jgi:glycosyltransferase involved in cell wall biosynthesis